MREGRHDECGYCSYCACVCMSCHLLTTIPDNFVKSDVGYVSGTAKASVSIVMSVYK